MALYQDEYIKVTQTDVSEINTIFAGSGMEVGLEIENLSADSLRVSAVDITANGVQVEKSELLKGELRPGNKRSVAVHFYYKAFADGSVKTVSDVKDVSFGIKYEIGDTGVKKINGPLNAVL